MAVVDLYGGSLTTPVPAVSGAVAAVGAKLGLFPPPQRCKLCTLHSVDPQMFRGRPGLIVHQVGSGCTMNRYAHLTLPSLPSLHCPPGQLAPAQ